MKDREERESQFVQVEIAVSTVGDNEVISSLQE